MVSIDMGVIGGGIAEVMFKAGIVVGLAITVAALGFLYTIWKKYNVNVIIIGFDTFGQKVLKNDKGGTFIHTKTNHKRFWLRKTKGYSFDPDKVRIVYDVKGKKYAYFVQYGSKDIRPLQWNFSKEKGVSANIDESDANWFLSEKAKWDKIIFPSKLLQWLPWIGLFFVGTIFMVLMIVLFNKWDVLESVSANLVSAADKLATANSDQMILK